MNCDVATLPESLRNTALPVLPNLKIPKVSSQWLLCNIPQRVYIDPLVIINKPLPPSTEDAKKLDLTSAGYPPYKPSLSQVRAKISYLKMNSYIGLTCLK